MLLFSMDEWNNSQSSIEGILDGNRRADKAKPEMQLQKANRSVQTDKWSISATYTMAETSAKSLPYTVE